MCMLLFFSVAYACGVNLWVLGNKTKERILKRVFQENKARQNRPKNDNFLPPNTQKYVCVSGGKKCLFFGKFGMLCFLETSVSWNYRRSVHLQCKWLWVQVLLRSIDFIHSKIIFSFTRFCNFAFKRQNIFRLTWT